MNEIQAATSIADLGVLLSIHYPQWVRGLLLGKQESNHPRVSDTIAKEIRKKINKVLVDSSRHSYLIPEGRFMPLSMLSSWRSIDDELSSWSDHLRIGCSQFREEISVAVLSNSESDAEKEWQKMYPEDGGKPPLSFSMNYCRKEAQKVPSMLEMLDMVFCFSMISPHPLLLGDSKIHNICRDFSAKKHNQMAHNLILGVPVAYSCECQQFCRDILDRIHLIRSRARIRKIYSNKIKLLVGMDIFQNTEIQTILSRIKTELDKDGTSIIESSKLVDDVGRLLAISSQTSTVEGFMKKWIASR